mmetsp:Transcript_24829/g.44852  ORF Transcript_24829/g.44852 Transcript_24829/m.44852 type:complete len:237 (+) Transcript_24829:323-1033(+)
MRSKSRRFRRSDRRAEEEDDSSSRDSSDDDFGISGDSNSNRDRSFRSSSFDVRPRLLRLGRTDVFSSVPSSSPSSPSVLPRRSYRCSSRNLFLTALNSSRNAIISSLIPRSSSMVSSSRILDMSLLSLLVEGDDEEEDVAIFFLGDSFGSFGNGDDLFFPFLFLFVASPSFDGDCFDGTCGSTEGRCRCRCFSPFVVESSLVYSGYTSGGTGSGCLDLRPPPSSLSSFSKTSSRMP